MRLAKVLLTCDGGAAVPPLFSVIGEPKAYQEYDRGLESWEGGMPGVTCVETSKP